MHKEIDCSLSLSLSLSLSHFVCCSMRIVIVYRICYKILSGNVSKKLNNFTVACSIFVYPFYAQKNITWSIKKPIQLQPLQLDFYICDLEIRFTTPVKLIYRSAEPGPVSWFYFVCYRCRTLSVYFADVHWLGPFERYGSCWRQGLK